MNYKYKARLSISNKALLISICLISALWHSRHQYNMTPSSGEEPSVLIYTEESAVAGSQSTPERGSDLQYTNARQKACASPGADQEGNRRETGSRSE